MAYYGIRIAYYGILWHTWHINAYECSLWHTNGILMAHGIVFLQGLTRALMYTPCFCMLAILLFLRDLVTCYIALYTVLGIIVAVLGILNAASVTLGPIEALALSVTIGVSVDYLIHLAYAYKNSIVSERYYKARAAFLARASSITAAAVTTM